MTNKESIWITSLNEIYELSKEFNIQLYLDAGTLLGAIRDFKFIEWDNDIDLGLVFNDYIEGSLIAFMMEANKLDWNINYSNTVISLTKTNVEINICLYRRESEKFETQYSQFNSASPFLIFCRNAKNNVHKLSFGKGLKYSLKNIILKNKFLLALISSKLLNLFVKEEIKEVAIPVLFFEKLEKVIFYGKPFNIPSKTVDYLTFRYGNDWKVPRRDFDYFNEDTQIYKLLTK